MRRRTRLLASGAQAGTGAGCPTATRRSTWVTGLAGLTVMAALATACGSDETATAPTATTATTTTPSPDELDTGHACGDVPSRRFVVAGQHDDVHTERPKAGDGGGRRRPRGVRDSDHADEVPIDGHEDRRVSLVGQFGPRRVERTDSS